MLSRDFRRMVAFALVLMTTLVTMPVSAADFTTPAAVLGSVTAVGPVQLRGLAISRDGTLFSGDRVRASDSGSAKIALTKGSKIALDSQAEVQVSGNASDTTILLAAGNIGFTSVSGNPLRVAVQPFEIIASDASGNVALMNSGVVGVRASSGKVMVRNTKTSESFVLPKGEERLLFTTNGKAAKPLADIASTAPVPLPSRAPQAPAGQTGGLAMDTGAWVAVIAGAAVAGVAITGLIIALNNKDNIDESNGRISAVEGQFNTLQGRITNLTTAVNSQGASLATLSTAVSVLQSLAGVQANAAIASQSLLQALVALEASNPPNKAALRTGLQTQLTEATRLQTESARLGTGNAATVVGNFSATAILANQTNVFLPATGGPARASITNVINAGVAVSQIPNTTTVPGPTNISPTTVS
jgi:hypothetical protein